MRSAGVFAVLCVLGPVSGCRGCKKEQPPQQQQVQAVPSGRVLTPQPQPSVPPVVTLKKPGADDPTTVKPGDDEEDEDEDEDEARFWAVKVSISGRGAVVSARPGEIACSREDDGPEKGDCGPRKWITKLKGPTVPPSLLRAMPVPGWHFVRWEASVKKADGKVVPRVVPPTSPPSYVRAFRTEKDNGDVEYVIAVFEPDVDAGATDAASDASGASAATDAKVDANVDAKTDAKK